MYKIEWSKTASKDIRRLPKHYVATIIQNIESLRLNPHPATSKKLKGHADLYRLRHGDYRVIYQVSQQQLLIVVVEVGHRREIYRGY